AVVVTFTLICVYCVALAFGQPEPTTHVMVTAGAWILLEVCVYSLIALGFAALVGSRLVTVGILIAIELIVGPLLTFAFPQLAGLRQAFFFVSLNYIEPVSLNQRAFAGHEASLLAAVVIGAWLVGMLALGMLRTMRRDA
ncbi:MAG: hypothetical protein ACYDBS_05460, partial [Acidimicrobiales bacterium]